MTPDLLDRLAAASKQLPAVPKEWALGLAQAAVALAVALGAPLTPLEQGEVVGLSALALTLLVAGGTALRRGRLKHLTPALAEHYGPALSDAVVAALQGHTAAADAARGRAVARQLAAVEDAGETFAEAEAANAQNDPRPPEPVEPEPTGS